MSNLDYKMSSVLQDIASFVDESIKKMCGKRLGFCIIVFSEDDGGASNYISNTNRLETADALRALLARWEQDMPDIPHHKKH